MGPAPPLPLAWPSATPSGASQAFSMHLLRASQPFPRLLGHIHPALWARLAPLHSWRRSRSMNCHGQHFRGGPASQRKGHGALGSQSYSTTPSGKPLIRTQEGGSWAVPTGVREPGREMWGSGVHRGWLCSAGGALGAARGTGHDLNLVLAEQGHGVSGGGASGWRFPFSVLSTLVAVQEDSQSCRGGPPASTLCRRGAKLASVRGGSGPCQQSQAGDLHKRPGSQTEHGAHVTGRQGLRSPGNKSQLRG